MRIFLMRVWIVALCGAGCFTLAEELAGKNYYLWWILYVSFFLAALHSIETLFRKG